VIVGEYENSVLFSEASDEADSSTQSGSDVDGPFTEAMLRFDAEFLATPDHAHGATAIWSLVQPIPSSDSASVSAASSPQQQQQQQQQFRVIVANVGDSRCLWIGGDGQCLFATTDHKPKDPIEHQVENYGVLITNCALVLNIASNFSSLCSHICFSIHSLMQNVVFVFLLQRIVAAGGFVQQDRVDGELAVARAVGDSKFKQVCASPLKTTQAHLHETNSDPTASSTCFSE
jgi:serine/threonine protein phosphatase PrpC